MLIEEMGGSDTSSEDDRKFSQFANNSCFMKIFNTNCKETVPARVDIFGNFIVSSTVRHRKVFLAKIYTDEKNQ